MTVVLYANGKQVTYESFDHPHGEAGDLFLRLDPQVVLKPGDRIEWSGDLPEGKTQLWVRYETVLDMGTAPLKDSDRYTLGEEAMKQNPDIDP